LGVCPSQDQAAGFGRRLRRGRVPKRIQVGDQAEAELYDASSFGCVASDDDDEEAERRYLGIWEGPTALNPCPLSSISLSPPPFVCGRPSTSAIGCSIQRSAVPLGHPSIKIDDIFIAEGRSRAELNGCQMFGVLIRVNDRLAHDRRVPRLFEIQESGNITAVRRVCLSEALMRNDDWTDALDVWIYMPLGVARCDRRCNRQR
jgi:hypothetical protein